MHLMLCNESRNPCARERVEIARCKRLEETCHSLGFLCSKRPISGDKRHCNTQIIFPHEFICMRQSLVITQLGRKYFGMHENFGKDYLHANGQHFQLTMKHGLSPESSVKLKYQGLKHVRLLKIF